MKRLSSILFIVVAIAACGDVTGDGADGRLGGGADGPGAMSTQPLQSLSPELRLVGLADVSAAFEVQRLRFDAELFLLPEDLDNVGDAVPIRFLLDEHGEHTDLPERPLRIRPGAYQVLVRVRPSDDGVSLSVAGEYAAPEDEDIVERGKADDFEPAPSPSEPAPSPSEPAPSPSEPAPSPSEPAPSPSEPAPSPSEPAPSDSASDLPSAEREPNADGDDGRRKADEDGLDAGETRSEGDSLFVRSTRSFEFYAGVVDIAEGDAEMIVTWDVRDWLRGVLAEPLGLPVLVLPRAEAPQAGFGETPTDFRIDAR
ncbi:MAG: hypothetical protein ACI9U2_001287 [Bradymonadia bacterium]|jgi:hypothetical protein